MDSMGILRIFSLYLLFGSFISDSQAKILLDNYKNNEKKGKGDSLKSHENPSSLCFLVNSPRDLPDRNERQDKPQEKLDHKEEKKESIPTLGNLGMMNKAIQSKTQSPQKAENLTDEPKVGAEKPQSSLTMPTEPEPASLPENQFESNHPSKVDLPVVADLDWSIIPHKAHYSISLDKNFSDDVSDVSGEMTLTTFDRGDGYVYAQRSSLIIYDMEGIGQQIITILETWQDYEGKQYRFHARTLCNGTDEEIIEGEAIKIPQLNSAVVMYKFPEKKTISIPIDTLFPLHHLLTSMKEAKKGKGGVAHTVFDGASETCEAVYVDTILGAPQPSHLVINTGSAERDKTIQTQWPMRLSVYNLEDKNSEDKNAESEYYMLQTVLESGVIKDMTMDHGAFQIKATLDKIHFYDGQGGDSSMMKESEGSIIGHDS